VQSFKNRGELDELLLQREISQHQKTVDRALNRPVVSLFANYRVLNILDSNPNPGFVDGYAIGGTMLWNLYDGGATNARINRQQTTQAIVETQFAEVRDRIRLQVEQSYNTLQTNLSNIQTATVALGRSKEVLRLSRIGFQAGVVTQLEVTTAQTELTRTETNLVRSILNYNRALAALRRAVNLVIPKSASQQ
jgi:outer membrane protein TolC